MKYRFSAGSYWETLPLFILLLCLSACTGTSSEGEDVAIPDPTVEPTPTPLPTPEPKLDASLEHFDGRALTAEQQHQLDLRVINSDIQPASEHPRLYGNNVAFFRQFEYLENFDPNCDVPGVTKGLGQLPNFKRMWQARMSGGVGCDNPLNGDLNKHYDANRYLSGQITSDSWPDNGVRIRVMHLLRRELFCQNHKVTCVFEKAAIKQLAQSLLTVEINRLKNAPRADQAPLYADEMNLPAGYTFNRHWHKANDNRFMVLDAAQAFKFWTLVLDVFHSDAPLPAGFETLLSAADRTFIEQQLEHELDSYLLQVKYQHWSIMNGNNWTVMLNSAAFHWALLNFYEQPDKSKEVINTVLKTNWLHRDYYQQDGGYLEGGSYALSTSYPYILMLHKLQMAAFAQPLHSFKWWRGEQMAKWFMDSYASDSYLIDFGDAHSQQGMSSSAMLDLMMVEKLISHDTAAYADVDFTTMGPDAGKACEFKRYFSNIYFDVLLDDPWNSSAFYFYDWQSLIEQCSVPIDGKRVEVYPQSGLVIADLTLGPLEGLSLFQQNYGKNQLFMTSTATDVPHREMDIGGVIWSAYGNRLLSDFGYGRILRNYYEYDLFTDFNGNFENRLDHALGANTLILPEAFQKRTDINNDFRFEYIGQGHGGQGTLTPKEFAGFNAVVLDASDAYGAPQEGKFARPAISERLKHFSRSIIAIEDTFLIIDSIAAQDDKTTLAEEYFYVPYRHKDGDAGACDYPVSEHVNMTLHASDSDTETPAYAYLEPLCSQLERGQASEVAARLYGFSLQPGGFTIQHPEYLTGDAAISEFSADALQTGANGENLIAMTNVLNKRLERQILRWKPLQANQRDLRLFVLKARHAGLQANSPLDSNVTVKAATGQQCEQAGLCWDLTLGSQAYRLEFVTNDSGDAVHGAYQLQSLTPM